MGFAEGNAARAIRDVDGVAQPRTAPSRGDYIIARTPVRWCLELVVNGGPPVVLTRSKASLLAYQLAKFNKDGMI